MRRGQISIDKIVAVRSSVLPLYMIVQADGFVTAADEVSEDGNDFLTTRMHGDLISFQSIRGHYLSAAGDEVCTRRYCSIDERFAVEKKETQYAFRTRSGKYLSVLDREPFVGLADSCDETEVFQLFSLMIFGVNVGKQFETLERHGHVMIDGLLDDERLDALRTSVLENGETSGSELAGASHEVRVANLGGASDDLAEIAVHPVLLQLVRRLVSCRVKLSFVESCRTNAEHVRKELEVTTWHVAHPYSAVEFPGASDPRLSLTAVWFLDDLTSSNSTWAWVRAPCVDGPHLPRLPQLSSPEEIDAVVKDAQGLTSRRGALWLYLGPVWLSNNIGAASFWKDYDAQTRYKHLSGQKEQSQSFRALTDAQRGILPKDEMCPMLISATYIREYIDVRDSMPGEDKLSRLKAPLRRNLEQLVVS